MPYVVQFHNLGYYAEKQEYEWQFTDDIYKAKIYKSLSGATERKDEAKICKNYGDGGISIIEIEEIITLRMVKTVFLQSKEDMEKEREAKIKQFQAGEDAIKNWQQKKNIV